MVMDKLSFALTSKSTAVAYHLRGNRSSAWAICTINDATHELSVQSDWGEWAYRWYGSFGTASTEDGERPKTLTEFIAEKDPSATQYLAAKLMKREQRERFCPRRTVRYFGEQIRDARRDNRISRDEHIEIARELAELQDVDDVRDFINGWLEIRRSNKVLSEPWECLSHISTNEYLVLRDAILPALVFACREHHNNAEPERAAP